MVKKLKKMADKKAAAPPAGTVKDSAQQIWLAGLGAFAKAQEEGGKVFEALVKEGTSLQRKTQAAAEEKIGEMANKMSHMAGDVTAKAGQQWDKLESIFEERTSRALNKLGVPTSKDIEVLIARIDELSAQVAKLSKAASTRAAKPAAAKPVSTKTAKGVVKPAAKRTSTRRAS